MMSIQPETSTDTPSGAAQIQVSGLAKRYGALQVFRGIEFNGGEREIVAIVGPRFAPLPPTMRLPKTRDETRDS